MVTEVQINDAQLEAEKENAQTLAKETSRDQNAFCIESLFYTSFREHQLGQPKNGNRDAIKNITVNDLETHKENTFVGKNFAVVVTGEINHESVVATSDKWLNTL